MKRCLNVRGVKKIPEKRRKGAPQKSELDLLRKEASIKREARKSVGRGKEKKRSLKGVFPLAKKLCFVVHKGRDSSEEKIGLRVGQLLDEGGAQRRLKEFGERVSARLKKFLFSAV